MKVATTREVIEKLQAYEKENGVGAIIGITTHMNGDRENNFCFEIASGSWSDLAFKDPRYKRTDIEISAVDDEELFPTNNEKWEKTLRDREKRKIKK